jgi:hypothetical protein
MIEQIKNERQRYLTSQLRNCATARTLIRMKMAKAIRQQALTAERVAFTTNDAVLAAQMRNLAQAFRAQADTMKKNKKKKKKK